MQLMQPEQQLKKVLFQEEAQLWLIYQRMSLRGQKNNLKEDELIEL
jgi:hypothetical protein